jgi:cytidine deaminase
MDKDFNLMYKKAKAVLNPRRLSETVEVGGVSAAIFTDTGNIYVGVCIDTACSMGFCAEHSAAAAMITSGEHKIKKIIAIDWGGSILPPCGRCREFLLQLHIDNGNADVMVKMDTIVKLKELLPYHWMEKNN